MKNIKYIIGILALTLCGLFTASCSDDKDEVINITFPEAETETVVIGQKGTISFEAAANWKLSSSALWLKFIVDGEMESTCQGKSGLIEVEYVITGENAETSKEDKAEVTLFIGAKEQVILSITREALPFELSVKDTEGNVVDIETPVFIGYNSSSSVVVKGNFKWAVTEAPEWVNFTTDKSGDVNKETTISFNMTEGFSKDAQSGHIVFTNINNTARFEVAVAYDGIPSDKIEIIQTLSPWNWVFAADGASYYKLDIDGNIADEGVGSKNINVIARKNEYFIVNISVDAEWGGTVTNEWTEWFHVDDNKEGSLDVTPSANTGVSREGYVLVFPKGIYESIADNIEYILFEENSEGFNELKAEYFDYIALHFSQESERSNPFKAIEGNGAPIEMINLFDQIDEDKVQETIDHFGTSNIWILSLENKHYESIIIDPSNLSDWSTVAVDCDLSTKWDGVEFEAGFSMETKRGSINIYNVTEGSGRPQMILNVISSDILYGVIIVEQW